MKIGLIKWFSKNDYLTKDVIKSLDNKYNDVNIDSIVKEIFDRRFKSDFGWLEASRKSAIKSTLKEVIREHKTQIIAEIVCDLTDTEDELVLKFGDLLTIDEIKLAKTKIDSVRSILLENDIINNRFVVTGIDRFVVTGIVSKSTSKDLIKRFEDRLLFKKHEKCYFLNRKKFDFGVSFDSKSNDGFFNGINPDFGKEIADSMHFSEEKTKKLLLKFDAIFIDDLQNNLLNHFNITEQKMIIDIMRKRGIKGSQTSWWQAFKANKNTTQFINYVTELCIEKKDPQHSAKVAALTKFCEYLKTHDHDKETQISFEDKVHTARSLRKYGKSELWNKYTSQEKEFIDLMVSEVDDFKSRFLEI